jgi:hypothetical protein
MHLSRLAIAVGLVAVSCGGSDVVPSGGSVDAPRAGQVRSEDVVIAREELTQYLQQISQEYPVA